MGKKEVLTISIVLAFIGFPTVFAVVRKKKNKEKWNMLLDGLKKEGSNKDGDTSPSEAKPTIMREGDRFNDIRDIQVPNIQDLRLCGGIIFAGDICVLVGPTNIGKSIVATQIAIDIARARSSSMFPDMFVCGMPNDVYLYDAEQRLEQVKDRYFSNDQAEYPANIVRYPSKDEENPANLELVFNTMEKTVHGATKSVTWELDNMTFLCRHNTPAQIAQFLDKVNGLRKQMREKGLYFTLILVAHTNDSYNKEFIRPIKERDIYGSSFLPDFADSIIGIHRSSKDDTEDKHPYIQIIKSRVECNFPGFLTQKVSRPYVMLKYADKLSHKQIVGERRYEEDFSEEGVDVMFTYMYIGCGMSPGEIASLYHCSDTLIRNKFKQYYGEEYTQYPRCSHNPKKGRDIYEHRKEYINQVPKQPEGEEKGEQE